MSEKMTRFEIDICNQQQAVDVDEDSLRRTVTHVLEVMQVSAASVSVAVVDNAAIRRLKAEYFQMDVVTDVISFDLADDAGAATGRLDCEVVVNGQRAAEEAAPPRSPPAELNLYLVHGLLHQLGYDDRTTEMAAVMHEKEDQLLDELGFGRIYSGKG